MSCSYMLITCTCTWRMHVYSTCTQGRGQGLHRGQGPPKIAKKLKDCRRGNMCTPRHRLDCVAARRACLARPLSWGWGWGTARVRGKRTSAASEQPQTRWLAPSAALTPPCRVWPGPHNFIRTTPCVVVPRRLRDCSPRTPVGGRGRKDATRGVVQPSSSVVEDGLGSADSPAPEPNKGPRGGTALKFAARDPRWRWPDGCRRCELDAPLAE